MTFEYLLLKLTTRLSQWNNGLSEGLTTWNGIGFDKFKSGFQDDGQIGIVLQLRDYHSVWVDWITRMGWIGLVPLTITLIWIIRQAILVKNRWHLIFFLYICTFQSLEGMPLIGLLWLAWLSEIFSRENDEFHVQSHIKEWRDAQGGIFCCDESRQDCHLNES